MILNLTPDRRIVGTDRCWQTERKRIVKGSPRWTSYKWHTELGDAVRGLAHEQIRVSPVEGVVDALAEVEHVCTSFSSQIDMVVDQVTDHAQRKLRAVS